MPRGTLESSLSAVRSSKIPNTLMGQDTFFITTAIDYTNSAPHIGHAYEKLLADVITRYQRSAGKKTYFLTGVDQHGQKVQQSAEREGIPAQEFADRNTEKFVEMWTLLGLEFDGWAATTHPQHKAVVQAILQKLFDQDQIYKATHTGYYSVRQEQFLTDKERNEDGEFGSEWGEVEERTEENYYFKLSEHVPWLKAFVASHPDFVYPAFRGKELVNALEKADAIDLCITRPKSRLEWGIEIPFDTEFVTFVWFDALINYISFAGYLKDQVQVAADGLPSFDDLWPANAHIIGKDIMIPAHAVYWPIMLHAMGFADEEMPKLLVHGFWNDKGGAKLSKSLGNVIDPADRIERFGADGLRYYLMSAIATGKDADFNDARIEEAYSQDLAGNLGNLLNRSLNMSKRYRASVLKKDADYDDDLNRELRDSFSKLPAAVAAHMEHYQVHLALEEIWKSLTLCNQFVEHSAPWKLAKAEAEATRLDTVLYHLAEAMAHAAFHIASVMPKTSQRMLEQLNFEFPTDLKAADLTWGILPDGHTLGEGTPLFPRLDPLPEAS